MTKEEAKRNIAALQAYIDGKNVEILVIKGWTPVSDDEIRSAKFRIKESRPYETVEELDNAIKEHGAFIKSEKYRERCIIVEYDDAYIKLSDMSTISYMFLFENWTWLDGTRCGLESKTKEEISEGI